MIREVIRNIGAYGDDPAEMDVLELFGGMGTLQDIYIPPLVKSLEVWEVELTKAKKLKENIPEATIRNVDSFKEVNLKRNKDRFHLVISDNFILYKQHSENFDLFPEVFNIIKDGGWFITNLFVNPQEYREEGLTPEYYAARANFFGGLEPLDLNDLLGAYHNLLRSNHRKAIWAVVTKRSQNVVYLGLKICHE